MHGTSQNDYLSRAQSSFLTALIFPRQILISIHFSVAIKLSDVINMQSRNSSVFVAAKLFNKTDFKVWQSWNRQTATSAFCSAELKLKISECNLCKKSIAGDMTSHKWMTTSLRSIPISDKLLHTVPTNAHFVRHVKLEICPCQH